MSDLRNPQSAIRNPKLLLLAAWFALLTGLGEVSLLAVKKFFFHQILFVSRDVVWMAPLANLVFFVIAGLILFLAGWRSTRPVSLRMAIFVFVFLGSLSLLFMFSGLHRLAALLLAVGLALQTARFIAARADAFYSLVQRTTGWMAALVVILAVSMHGLQGFAERRALAKLLPPTSSAPNVLLIVLDTVRAQNLSVYGYERPTTPQLERLAKRSVRLERAISTAPWTLPSHASMFTGRFPYELFANWKNPLDATYPTLAEMLSAHGYVTAGFVANLYYCNFESGLDRGFAHYEDYPISPGQIVLSSSLGRSIVNSGRVRRTLGYYEDFNRKTAAELNREFLTWLSQNDRRPFFAFLNYFDAHSPYLPPKPFDVKFGPKKSRGNPMLLPGWKWSPGEIQAELDAYDGAIAYLDHQLGLLFDELEKRDVLENTLVIITSDHGEEFGEHGVMMHGYSVYLPSLHVPLLMSFPSRVPAGTSVPDLVSLRDLPATVIDLIGLDGGVHFPGASLARYWNGPRTTDHGPLLSEVNFASGLPKWYPVSKGNMKSLVVDRYHYIRNGDGREELYNFEDDPLEKHDLAHLEESRRALERFRTSLETILNEEKSEARNPKSETNSNAPSTKSKTVGCLLGRQEGARMFGTFGF